MSILPDSAISIAPGSIVTVRDEEWLVTGVEHTADGRLLRCQASVVADGSPHYRRSRL